MVAAAGGGVAVAAAAAVGGREEEVSLGVIIANTEIKFPILLFTLTIYIRKHFVPHGEWTLHPTKIGVTLSLYE
jgi:hypothetical protein